MTRGRVAEAKDAAPKRLDDAALLAGVLARDEAAWREFVRRFSPALRDAVRATTDEPMQEQDVSDVLGDFWLRMIDDDMRRLRAFDPSRGVALDSWLAIRAAQVAYERTTAERAGPRFEPLEEARHVPAPAPPIERRSVLMRVEEVAERWDLNVKTVYGMIDRGELAARRCGRLVRVPRRVVESFEQASVVPQRRTPCR